jgi:hypothetical protein
MGWTRDEVEKALAVFRERGMVGEVPTAFQLLQGVFAMTPYVLSSDATNEARYRGAPFGRPLLRQPILIWETGFDHLRVGPAFGAKIESLCTHLHMTYHQGMPVFDLQVAHCKPGGLQRLRERTEEVLAGETEYARHRRKVQRLIFPSPDGYLREFLGDDGWIARAERFDYPKPDSEDSAFPPEFFSLVDFVNHCARAYPARVADVGAVKVPFHLAYLAARRMREGRRALPPSSGTPSLPSGGASA